MFFSKNNDAKSTSISGSSSHVHYKEELAKLTDAVTRLTTKIEMIEAKEEAQKEIRDLNNQKFDKLAGQIGEVRELFKVLSSEKKEMDVKISQTIELVKQVSPTTIAKQLSGFGHQLSVVEGKIQLITKQYDSFKKDFDHFSHKLKFFKGEDELIKLQTRVKQDLDDVNKISHQANMHASKIENHFIKINEKATALANGLAEIKGLKDALTQLQIDLTKQSEALKTDAVSTNVDAKLAELEETVGGLADLTTETFTKLRSEIAAHKERAASVSPVEFEKMKRWVMHLIKSTQAHSGTAKKK